MHHGCVCAPVGVVTGIAHLVPVLDLVQEALLCVALIAHDVGQLFQRVGSVQGGGVVAVAGKGLHGEAVGAGLVVGHIFADLLQHVVVAAVHGLMVVCLILAVSIPVGVGDADHLLAFRHHIQVAHGAVTGDGLVEETLAVIAEDGPDAAEGEGRAAVDAGCLACTGAGLHGSACPQHHTDAGTVTAHGRNVVHVGAVLAVGPCQVAQGVAQVQTHVRVAAEVAGCHDDSIGIDLEVLAVDVGEDGAGNLAVLVHQGQTLCAVDVLAALFHGLLLQQTDGVRPHVVVGVGVRTGITPLGHADVVVAVAAGVLEVLVALVVHGVCVLGNIVGVQLSQHPVQCLTRAGGVVLDDLLVGVAQSLDHVLGEDVHGVVLLGTLVQEELGVVGGQVAGIVVVLFPGLHFAADGVQALFCAAQGGGSTGLTGTDDQNFAVLGVLDLVGQLGLIAQPGGLVVHELLFRDVQGIDHTDHHGAHDVAVALLLEVLFRGLGSLGVRVGAAVGLRVAGGKDVVPGDGGRGGGSRLLGSSGRACHGGCGGAAGCVVGAAGQCACSGSAQSAESRCTDEVSARDLVHSAGILSILLFLPKAPCFVQFDAFLTMLL